MLKIYRYVFYRIARFQRTVISDDREAVLSAVIYISSVPFLVPIIGLVAFHDARSIFEALDTSIQAATLVALFILIVWIHYATLGRADRMANIDREFMGGDRFGTFGTLLTIAYFASPICLGIVVLVYRS